MRKGKILIIEDETFIAEIYETKLKSVGFEVISAKNGVPGIELARIHRPDLILLDIILPEMSGFYVLEQMKKDPELKKIPVLILSNLGDEKDKKHGLELGAIDYIVKSDYTPDEVTKIVEKIFKSKHEI